MKPFTTGGQGQISNLREAKFAKFLTNTHVQWQYHNRSFSFGNPSELYTPDFYVPTRGTFYEVLGTRQAFHQSHRKIARFLRAFPKIRFRLVRPNGEDIPYYLKGETLIIQTPTGQFSHLKTDGKYPKRNEHPEWRRLKLLAVKNGRTMTGQLTVVLDAFKEASR